MKTKVIAIGNILMKDDGIGIRVAEGIRERLEKCGIEVIIGETDFEYCASKIEEGDFLYIIDAAYSGKTPGEITVIPIENYRHEANLYSQHGYSVINIIFLHYKLISGYIIGIEISEIDYHLNLSDELTSRLKEISENVFEEIIKQLH
jgi:hydrogenase maturation protease